MIRSLWAAAVLDVANKVKGLDMEYIRRRAEAENVVQELNGLLGDGETGNK